MEGRPPPGEEPTRVDRPGEPPREPAVARRREVVVDDERALLEEIVDRVASLRRWAYLATVLGLLALAIGVAALLYALDARDSDRVGASRQQVRELRDDVDRLEEDVDNGRRSATIARDTARENRDRIEELEQQVGEAGDAASAEELQDLETRVDGIADSVERLRAR